MANHFYLDLGGKTYPQALEIQEEIKPIESNIAMGSLHIHCSAQEFISKFPHYSQRVLGVGDTCTRELFSDALKAEGYGPK